ncbi:unnamed protein product [Prunus armeniaca]
MKANELPMHNAWRTTYARTIKVRPSRAEHTSEDGGVKPWWDKVENKHAKCLGRSWGMSYPEIGSDLEVGRSIKVECKHAKCSGRSWRNSDLEFRYTCKVVRSIMREMWSAQSRMQDDQLVYTCNVASSVTHTRWPSGSSL